MNTEFVLIGKVTLSIGSISGKFVFEGLYEKLGINTEIMTRGENADIYTSHKPFNDEQRVLMQKNMTECYNTFVTKVAEGRNMTFEQVDKIGQGRIWTGKQALEIGLVDEIGGLTDAINEAKRQIGLSTDDPVRVMTLPIYNTSFKFGTHLSVMLQELSSIEDLEPIGKLADKTKLLAEEDVLYIMPYHLEIK